MNIYRHIEDLPSLEREYSPSSCVADVNVFIREYAQHSAQARDGNPAMQTVHYGAHAAEAIDYFPAASRDAPLLVFIHGGYWQELSKADASFPATDCGRNAVAYAAINYGLAPEATLAQMIARCRAALAALYRQAADLGFDANSIFISGSSAGAHLAAMVLLTNWEDLGLPRNVIKGAALLSGIFDLQPIVLTYVNAPLRLDAATARLHSPLLHFAKTDAVLPPVLLAYGDNETSEFKRQSAEFADALQRRAARVELLCIAGRNHFDIAFDLVDERTVLGRATLALIQRSNESTGEIS